MWPALLALLGVEHVGRGFARRALPPVAMMADSAVASLERQIAQCSGTGRWQQALKLLEELRSVAGAPSTRAVNSAATACSRAGAYGDAISLLNELAARDAWDSFSYTTAITVFFGRGRWRRRRQSRAFGTWLSVDAPGKHRPYDTQLESQCTVICHTAEKCGGNLMLGAQV